MEKVSAQRAFSELGSLYLSVQVLREENAAHKAEIERLRAVVEVRDAEILKLQQPAASP